MSRKRNSLSQSISSLAASIPDIPVPVVITAVDQAFKDDHAVRTTVEVRPDGGFNMIGSEVLPPATIGDHTDHVGEPDEMTIPPESPLDLFKTWSLTPEGHRVRDSRVPTDPVRLGCILDDNARIAFLAGYAAANPSFE